MIEPTTDTSAHCRTRYSPHSSSACRCVVCRLSGALSVTIWIRLRPLSSRAGVCVSPAVESTCTGTLTCQSLVVHSLPLHSKPSPASDRSSARSLIVRAHTAHTTIPLLLAHHTTLSICNRLQWRIVLLSSHLPYRRARIKHFSPHLCPSGWQALLVPACEYLSSRSSAIAFSLDQVRQTIGRSFGHHHHK